MSCGILVSLVYSFRITHSRKCQQHPECTQLAHFGERGDSREECSSRGGKCANRGTTQIPHRAICGGKGHGSTEKCWGIGVQRWGGGGGGRGGDREMSC